MQCSTSGKPKPPFSNCEQKLTALKDMIPALIESIKAQGLVLVTDKSSEPEVERNIYADPFPRLPEGIDGVLKGNGVLRFNESIDM